METETGNNEDLFLQVGVDGLAI